MKRIIFSLLAIFTLAFASNAQDLDKMRQIVNKVNDLCPYEYAEGITLQSVKIENGAILHTFSVNPQIVDYTFLKDNQQMLHDAKVAEITTDTKADSNAMRSACANYGTNIVYRYTNGDDSFDIVIMPSDFN